MENYDVYQDLARRTDGDIYLGVVGPVRTGKSTFVKRFAEAFVLPNVTGKNKQKIAADELPQSGAGKTVTTTEPKFIPGEAVKVSLNKGKTTAKMRVIDCVGYMVDGALGAMEGEDVRMVKTPWSEEAIPFSEAAEIGTGKVIGDHSTIGILVTTDGSFTDIPRESYIPAEERVAKELSEINKPYAIILNSATPGNEETKRLAASLEEKYGVPVALVDCTKLDREDVREILALVLSEFPVREEIFRLPEWITVLPEEHRLYREAITRISDFSDKTERFCDIEKALAETEGIEKVSVDAGDGTAIFTLPVPRSEFYGVVSEMTGLTVGDDAELLQCIVKLSGEAREYEKVSDALRDVRERGYGIVMPEPDEVELEEPELVKQPGGWGVKVTARADSIHMIKANIETEIAPIVGTEQQANDLIQYIGESSQRGESIWETNIFGKSIEQLVQDGIRTKISAIGEESQTKLQDTMQKIVNDSKGGMVCIII